MNGLRLGTPEIVRWGMTVDDMPELAALIARGPARRRAGRGGRCRRDRVPAPVRQAALRQLTL